MLAFLYGPLIMPSPLETLAALKSLAAGGDLWKMAGITVWRGLLGFALAAGLGVPAGLALGFSSSLEKAFRPVLVVIQTTPLVSWLLLAMIWFGLNGSVPVFIVFITTFPLIVINTYHGARSMDPALAEMARVYRIGGSRLITGVYLPQVIPFILAGFSAALGTTWKAVAMAELFSSRSGIGAGMSVARMNLETADIFAWTLVLVLLGLATEELLRCLARQKFLLFRSSGS
jgi:NitT/TauT family transport system permease protein